MHDEHAPDRARRGSDDGLSHVSHSGGYFVGRGGDGAAGSSDSLRCAAAVEKGLTRRRQDGSQEEGGEAGECSEIIRVLRARMLHVW